MIQNIILPQIGLPQEKNKHAIQGDHCVWETPYRETIVFRSNDPKYDTTSDWLVPETNLKTPYREPPVFGKRHTWRPLCSRETAGDHRKKTMKPLVPVCPRLAQSCLFEALPKTM